MTVKSSGAPATTETTKETTTTTASTQTKTTDTTTDSAPDASAWGRLFATPGAVPLFQLGVAFLAAFLAAAAVQRFAVGAYGLKIGSFELAELPAVTKAELKQALETIKDAPRLSPLLGDEPRGPQPFPQLMFLEEERDQLISIRLEVEEHIRKLAQELNIDPELSLDKILKRLRDREVITEEARKGLNDLIELGDRVTAGAKVDKRAATEIMDDAISVIYGLMELTSRAKRGDISA